MKTTITKLAAITFFSLFFLVGNVNAKGTKFDVPNLAATESVLVLEDWMVADTLWEIGETFFFEPVIEKIMELESWMTNKIFWSSKDSVKTETEMEQKLLLEPWMLNIELWKR